MEKHQATLYQKLKEHSKITKASFHVPGHKLGRGFNKLGKELFEDILKIDLTEITGLDDLHQPEGVILAAQRKAAKVFGAKNTYFLVNGSTAGNLAMIQAVCKPGDKIIVQRNVHKSVIHGLILAKAKPIYVYPEVIPELNIAGSVATEHLAEALSMHADAKAVFLMNPNYYGIGIDLTSIVKLVHSYNIPLLIDEAHGAHFGFHNALPNSSLKMGADVTVQSTHKTLSAMTMGSMLHINSKFIDEDRLKFFLSIFQTSSPSYPIMASLDLTTNWLEQEGGGIWDTQLEMLEDFYNKGTCLRNIEVNHSLPRRYYKDPLKIIIKSKITGFSGFSMQRYFENRQIYTELADLYNVLAIVTFGNSANELAYLYEKLLELDKQLNEEADIIEKSEKEVSANWAIINTLIENELDHNISLEQVINGRTKIILLDQAVGELAAEMVIPYPPGIPVLQLGEKISKQTIDYLKQLKNQGAKFQGIHDTSLRKIKVVDN